MRNELGSFQRNHVTVGIWNKEQSKAGLTNEEGLGGGLKPPQEAVDAAGKGECGGYFHAHSRLVPCENYALYCTGA